MSRKFIDRTGEENYNTFESEMIISEYRGALDIDVYFPEYDWTARSVAYCDFKKGNVKCPYERRCFGVGYLGEGKYKVCEKGNHTKCYRTWYNMLQRCYDKKFHKRELTYEDCESSKEFHNLQNFGDWFDDDYYEIEGEKMCLDKDILVKGNKIYSPETCIFVPHNINMLFVKCDKARGEYPVGVHYSKRDEKFIAQCNVYDNEKKIKSTKHLGLYNTPEEAFYTYKQFKEKYIKQVADYYKDKIPQKLYDAMYNYKVEIND